MKTIFISLVFFFAFGLSFAQMLPNARPISSFMADSTGKNITMDFKIKLAGIQDANTLFSVFEKRPLAIYYFSPSCPHCIRNFPAMQQTLKEYESRGLASIAVAVSGAQKKDIRMFIEQQRATIPFFHDSDSKFGEMYGDGYVPRLFLVFPDGKIIRHTSTGSENLSDIKADFDRALGKK